MTITATTATAPAETEAAPQPFRASDNLLSFQMSRGHWMRCGHELTGRWEQSPACADAVVLVKTCCDGHGGPLTS